LGSIARWVRPDYIELTNSYPLLEFNEEDNEEEMNNYERTISSINQNFNIDNNKVGWYYISNSNDYQSYDVFYSNLNYAAKKKISIFMVYDTIEARSGAACPFKAYFISEAWLKAINNEDMTDLDLNELRKFNLKYDKMYTSVPISIKVNPLTKLFLTQHEKNIRENLDKLIPVNMDTNLAANIKNMEDTLEEMSTSIATLHDNMKPNNEKQKNDQNLVDFMGQVLKGLDFTNRIKDNTDYNLTNIKLAEHLNNSKNRN